MRRLVFVMLPVLGACFHYVPLTDTSLTDELDRVERGSPVRTQFVNEESVQLGDMTVQHIVSMDAEFVRKDNSDVVLSAFWLDSSVRQDGFPGDGWTVRIPIGNIANFQLKKLSVWRTGVVLAGAVLGSYLAWEGFTGGGSSGAGGNGGGGVSR
jgi:hypothetical protein